MRAELWWFAAILACCDSSAMPGPSVALQTLEQSVGSVWLLAPGHLRLSPCFVLLGPVLLLYSTSPVNTSLSSARIRRGQTNSSTLLLCIHAALSLSSSLRDCCSTPLSQWKTCTHRPRGWQEHPEPRGTFSHSLNVTVWFPWILSDSSSQFCSLKRH